MKMRVNRDEVSKSWRGYMIGVMIEIGVMMLGH
jgi:hypothetical protein